MAAFSAQVLDHFEHPRNVGSFDAEEPGVYSGGAGSAAEGEMIRLQIQIRDAQIVASRFRAFGCTATIAAASWLSDAIIGMAPGEALRLEPRRVVMELELADDRVRLAKLAVDALAGAIQAWQARFQVRG